MSAYTKALAPRVCDNCHKPATVEVFNTRNSSIGIRCSRCGLALVRRLDQNEADDMARRIKGARI